jgi:hypothetical protein
MDVTECNRKSIQAGQDAKLRKKVKQFFQQQQFFPKILCDENSL